MTHNFKTLHDYLSTLPVTKHLADEEYDSTPYKLFQDDKHHYLVSFDPFEPNDVEFIHLGYVIKKSEFSTYQNAEEVVIFEEGFGFVSHNLEGKCFFSKRKQNFYEYIVNGVPCEDKEEFDLHPEVIAHKNKLSLKKKISLLK